MPGDKSRAAHAKAVKEGIELSPEIVDILREVAILTKKEAELESILVHK